MGKNRAYFMQAKLYDIPMVKYELGSRAGIMWRHCGYSNATEAVESTVGWEATLEEFEKALEIQALQLSRMDLDYEEGFIE